MQKIPLLCLPFAGGSRYSYRNYEQATPSFIELHPLEYPGRGRRLQEGLLTDMEAIISDLYLQVDERIFSGNYAIYGHSMGGLAALLLARFAVLAGRRPPVHLFITGAGAPCISKAGKKMRHLLGKTEFIDEIRALKGCPSDVLENHSLLELFEPILRADFCATESYTHRRREQLDIPFTIMTGTMEELEAEEILGWQEESGRPVDFYRMDGNHFFIYDHAVRIMEIVGSKLKSGIEHWEEPG
jgi:surfactin synthase thioesterase subunit